MKRIRMWLLYRFLPEYCKQKILEENERLKLQVSDLKQEIGEREAYIRGLEYGIRRQRIAIFGNAKKAGE